MIDQTTAKWGLIAGGTISFTGAIGMIDSFNDRILVNPILSMGYLILFLIPAIAGYMAAQGVVNVLEGPNRDVGLGSVKGATAGLIAGLVAAVFILIANGFDFSAFFPNINSRMIGVMTFDLGLGAGIGLVVFVSIHTPCRQTLTER